MRQATHRRITLLGSPIDVLTMEETVQWVAKAIAAQEPRQIITANPELLYRAYYEPDLRPMLQEADLMTADGAGILWAASQVGTPLPERVTGIDLAEALVQEGAARGWRFFFLGAAPGVAEEAARRKGAEHPGLQIAGVHHGYFGEGEDRPIIAQIKEARPDILFVALGAPRQEQWIRRHRQELGVPVSVGIGGSFDVWSGKAKRASTWVQRIHLEWLVRLIREPWRWKRMLNLPKFMVLVLRNKK